MIIFDKNSIYNENIHKNYKVVGFTSVNEMRKLIESVKLKYANIEIHVNDSTCAMIYNNNIENTLLLNNLNLICNNKKEVLQSLAEIYGGAFDISNRKFWLNRKDGIDIVINNTVNNGYSYIVSNCKIVGYCEHGDILMH